MSYSNILIFTNLKSSPKFFYNPKISAHDNLCLISACIQRNFILRIHFCHCHIALNLKVSQILKNIIFEKTYSKRLMMYQILMHFFKKKALHQLI